MKTIRLKILPIILFLFIFICAGNVISANAYSIEDGWNLNLSGVLTGLGNYTNIDRIDVSGTAYVNQSYGVDGVFSDNDSFTEYSQLNQVIYYTEPGAPADIKSFSGISGGGYNMYLYATGLTGYAKNVSATNPADLATYKFDYVFNPYVGTISMYIDDNLDPLDGVSATLSTFDLAFGAGIGNPGFLGGATPNGTTNITSEFVSPLVGVFSTGSGTDFASLPAGWALGLLNTNNQVASLTEIAGTSPTGLIGFDAIVNSGGQMNVAVIPEPATMLLLGSGLLGLAGLGRKKKFFKKD